MSALNRNGEGIVPAYRSLLYKKYSESTLRRGGHGQRVAGSAPRFLDSLTITCVVAESHGPSMSTFCSVGRAAAAARAGACESESPAPPGTDDGDGGKRCLIPPSE